jgi:putative membrane protein
MFADATDQIAVTPPKPRPCEVPSVTQWAPVALGALSVCTGALVLAVLDLGPLSAHMAQHIALMNVLAPLAAILVFTAVGMALVGVTREGKAGSLWLAAAMQVMLLWAWHLPSLQAWGMSSAIGLVVMHASLFLTAFYFWMAVLTLAAACQWHAIFALLVTGKLACLLGSLLIFAPRPLYAASAGHLQHWGHTATTSTLADQQLAGLLMIVACPLSYLVAGVAIAAQIMRELGRASTSRIHRQVSPPLGR